MSLRRLFISSLTLLFCLLVSRCFCDSKYEGLFLPDGWISGKNFLQVTGQVSRLKRILYSSWQTTIGPLPFPVTWYGVNYTVTQVTQWDFQNKGTRTSPARLSIVFEVPLRNLCPSVIYSVPCDQIVQIVANGSSTVHKEQKKQSR